MAVDSIRRLEIYLHRASIPHFPSLIGHTKAQTGFLIFHVLPFTQILFLFPFFLMKEFLCCYSVAAVYGNIHPEYAKYLVSEQFIFDSIIKMFQSGCIN